MNGSQAQRSSSGKCGNREASSQYRPSIRFSHSLLPLPPYLAVHRVGTMDAAMADDRADPTIVQPMLPSCIRSRRWPLVTKHYSIRPGLAEANFCVPPSSKSRADCSLERESLCDIGQVMQDQPSSKNSYQPRKKQKTQKFDASCSRRFRVFRKFRDCHRSPKLT